MKKAVKNIGGLTVLLMLIAGLLCAVPSFAEESSQEKTESVEEIYLLVRSEERQVKTIKPDFSTQLFVDRTIASPGISRGIRSFTKLYILYQSLCFYDCLLTASE